MEQKMRDPADELVERLNKRDVNRPTLGPKVDVRVLQDRIAMTLLSPGFQDVFYYAGQRLGQAYAKKAGFKGLDDALANYAKRTEELGVAKTEVVFKSDTEVVLRLHENASCHGLNLGRHVCFFDAGTQAGFFSAATGQRVVSTERACCANGKPYCEFVLKFRPSGGGFGEAVAEALRV